MNLLRPAAFAAVFVLLLPAMAHADEGVARLIMQLDKEKPASERVAAAKQLQKMDDREALKAVEALAKNAADDDLEVRSAAISALGALLCRFEEPCHLSLVRAMFDEDRDNRIAAGFYVEIMAKRLPEGAAALLLEQAAHRDAMVRSCVLQTLAAAKGEDPTVLAVLRQAVHDRHPLVRNNALVALLKLNGSLSEAVPHWLTLLDESANPDANDAERDLLQLVKVGIASRFHELGQQEPKKLMTVLVALLKDDSPLVRGAAARVLGAVANRGKESTRIAIEFKARKAVEPLLKDPEERVRKNAAIALERLPD